MAITLEIEGVDKSTLIDWGTLRKAEVLTSEPDTLEFLIRNVPSKTYRPSIGDEVVLEDGAELMFGGLVIETTEVMRGLVKYFKIMCKDYTEVLDRTLVSKTYVAQTAEDIVADLVSTFATGFTTVNVDAPVLVPSLTFNYLPISQCLQKLTELLQGYDWYPDYSKDIHFFKTANNPAPFGLTDTSQNFSYKSLEFNNVAHQIRNSIIIRGGDTVGTAIENKQVADGEERVFFVGYNLTDFEAFHAPSGDPTNFTALTVGADGKDDPADYDVLYNPDRGLLTFPDASKPDSNDVVKITGIPSFPLIMIVQDSTSISAYGEYQYLVLDKTITTRDQARNRGQAELVKYGQPITSGSFETDTDGLKQGHTISIIVPSRSISGSFKIQKITTTLKSPTAWRYYVEFVSTYDITMVDILNKLLIQNPSDQIDIGANEIVDRIFTFSEEIAIADVLVSNINFSTQFVLGPYTPTPDYATDPKRPFMLNGSPLG